MAISIYPAHALRQPECALLPRPFIPIPKCWDAELRPLTALAGSLGRLPVGEVRVALLLAGTAEGANLKEVDATGYERQPVEFHLHDAGHRTTNIHPVVFRFDEQPGSNIPLTGLFVDDRLVMRGGLTRVLVPPEGTNMSEPQVRFEGGALCLRFGWLDPGHG